MKKKPDGYWTYEKCEEVIKKCKGRGELNTKYRGAYATISLNNWDLFDKYLPLKDLSYTYCKTESLKYDYKKDLIKNNHSCYDKIIRKKWYELFKHMEKIGNKRKRLIYVYEFDNNSCYVGLTGNIQRRDIQHKSKKNNDCIYKNIQSGISYKLIIVTDYIDSHTASEKEGEILNEYKNNGWIILNKTKTGNLGSSDEKYTFDFCLSQALKYKSKREFIKNNKKIYHAMVGKKYIDDIYKKMNWKRKKTENYWNYDNCLSESLKYENVSDLIKNNVACYGAIIKNNWLNDTTKHMKPKKHTSNYWTLEKCLEELKNHKTKSNFRLNSKGAYNACRRNKWMNYVEEYYNSST